MSPCLPRQRRCPLRRLPTAAPTPRTATCIRITRCPRRNRRNDVACTCGDLCVCVCVCVCGSAFVEGSCSCCAGLWRAVVRDALGTRPCLLVRFFHLLKGGTRAASSPHTRTRTHTHPHTFILSASPVRWVAPWLATPSPLPQHHPTSPWAPRCFSPPPTRAGTPRPRPAAC